MTSSDQAARAAEAWRHGPPGSKLTRLVRSRIGDFDDIPAFLRIRDAVFVAYESHGRNFLGVIVRAPFPDEAGCGLCAHRIYLSRFHHIFTCDVAECFFTERRALTPALEHKTAERIDRVDLMRRAGVSPSVSAHSVASEVCRQAALCSASDLPCDPRRTAEGAPENSSS